MITEKTRRDHSSASRFGWRIPCFFYLACAIPLSALAYPCWTWLPGYLDKFRALGYLLPPELLFFRYSSELVGLLAIASWALFFLSAWVGSLHESHVMKRVALAAIVSLALFGLLALLALRGV